MAKISIERIVIRFLFSRKMRRKPVLENRKENTAYRFLKNATKLKNDIEKGKQRKRDSHRLHPLPMLSNQGVNMALIHPNEWQIMLKLERTARDYQMDCIQHSDYSQEQSSKEIINLFSVLYTFVSNSFRSFACGITKNRQETSANV